MIGDRRRIRNQPEGVAHPSPLSPHMRLTAQRRSRRPLFTVILAAGKGKRMRSARAKVLHSIAGRSMIEYVESAARRTGASRLFVILGKHSQDVRDALGTASRDITFCLQKDQRGTAHAVLQTARYLKGKRGDVLILNGDAPTLRDDLLRRLVQYHREQKAAVTLVSVVLDDPTGYGRIVRDPSGRLAEIVEEADTRSEEKEIREVNCGLYIADCALLFRALKEVKPTNQQSELYLTDVVRILKCQGHKVLALQHDNYEEVLGVNTQRELAVAAKILYRRKAEELMRNGVSFIDPWHTYIDATVKVGRDTVIYPDVYLEGTTEIGCSCRIEPGCVIRDCVLGDETRVLAHSVLTSSRIHTGAQIGPFTHVRPASDIGAQARVGNFVEIKKSRLGEGVRAGHLSYLGDSRLGRRVNIGAGTITCNYDGEAKHPTVLEDDVFVGSDTQLVAPVRVRKGAYVGAGSTITQDVPPYALALSRSPQQNQKGWVRSRRAKQTSASPARKAPARSTASRSPYRATRKRTARRATRSVRPVRRVGARRSVRRVRKGRARRR